MRKKLINFSENTKKARTENNKKRQKNKSSNKNSKNIQEARNSPSNLISLIWMEGVVSAISSPKA